MVDFRGLRLLLSDKKFYEKKWYLSPSFIIKTGELICSFFHQSHSNEKLKALPASVCGAVNSAVHCYCVYLSGHWLVYGLVVCHTSNGTMTHYRFLSTQTTAVLISDEIGWINCVCFLFFVFCLLFLCSTQLEKEDFLENLHVLPCFVYLKNILLISCVFWILEWWASHVSSDKFQDFWQTRDP